MKFYLTAENISKIKKSFLNLKLFSIINVQEIIESYGYTYETIDDYSSFIINKKIIDLIKLYSNSKRTRGIIYCNYNINDLIINNLFDTLESNEKISNIVLIDDYNVPKLKRYYTNFNEIIFFPSFKKVKLTEIKEIDKEVEWKF